ncbi:hypothetical protein BJX70DRAFT_19956 [Aspergillus crustosus]
MPHTRRKIPPSQQNKRLQVTDSSGWTHVTTNGNARRLHRSAKNTQTQENEKAEAELETAIEPLLPAEAPNRTTLADLERQLQLYRQRWEESTSWRSVEEGLRRGLHSLLPLATSRRNDGTNEETEDAGSISIVCIGLGSPSGFLRGGWVDRRAVSMYQLAALSSVVTWIETHLPSSTPSLALKGYAQDPVFNKHDISLLASLNITVLEHPSAFAKISPRTLLFCPGAEIKHLAILLMHNPAMVFGGPLGDINSDVVRAWLKERESVALGKFEELEAAFWGMSIYYPSKYGDGEG